MEQASKDVKALKKSGLNESYQFEIIDAVMRVNEKQKTTLVDKIISFFGKDLSGIKFALWGLAFKPETDDIREAPSLEIIAELKKLGANITAYDPEAMNNVKDILGNSIEYAKTSLDAMLEQIFNYCYRMGSI